MEREYHHPVCFQHASTLAHRGEQPGSIFLMFLFSTPPNQQGFVYGRVQIRRVLSCMVILEVEPKPLVIEIGEFAVGKIVVKRWIGEYQINRIISYSGEIYGRLV